MVLTNYESPKYPRNKGVERAEMKVISFCNKYKLFMNIKVF